MAAPSFATSEPSPERLLGHKGGASVPSLSLVSLVGAEKGGAIFINDFKAVPGVPSVPTKKGGREPIVTAGHSLWLADLHTPLFPGTPGTTLILLSFLPQPVPTIPTMPRDQFGAKPRTGINGYWVHEKYPRAPTLAHTNSTHLHPANGSSEPWRPPP